MNTERIISYSLSLGFSSAAITDTASLVVVPEYRKYCEENLCGRYNNLPVCPPACGTVDEMVKRFRKYKHALILQTTVSPEDGEAFTNPNSAKFSHNDMSLKVIELMKEENVTDTLLMSAGPWKGYSCLSAYCIDCQKMADSVGMLCWAHDGKNRFFTVICY